MKITKEEFAAKLNGREYGKEITKEEEAQAKLSGLLILFGYSDDNVELRGVDHDEIYAADGAMIHLDATGLLQRACEDDGCPHEKQIAEESKVVEAAWCEEDDYSWTFRTDLPHTTFDIVEGEEKFCRGIVIDMQEAFGVNSTLAPHQQRVMQEKVALDTKCLKLQEFLDKNPTLASIELDLLTAQLQVMVAYSEILRKRIDLF